MPALNLTVDIAALEPNSQHKQRRRMMLASVLLLMAPIIVVAKSHDMWFQALPIGASEVLQDTLRYGCEAAS
jgi:hypothetical protein